MATYNKYKLTFDPDSHTLFILFSFHIGHSAHEHGTVEFSIAGINRQY